MKNSEPNYRAVCDIAISMPLQSLPSQSTTYSNQDKTITYGVVRPLSPLSPKQRTTPPPWPATYTLIPCLCFGTSSNNRLKTSYWFGYSVEDCPIFYKDLFFITHEICRDLKQHRVSNIPHPDILTKRFKHEFTGEGLKNNYEVLDRSCMGRVATKAILIQLGEHKIVAWSYISELNKGTFLNGSETAPLHKVLTETASNILIRSSDFLIIPKLVQLSNLIINK